MTCVVIMKGSIDARKMSIKTKQPILLAKEHQVSFLINKHLHEKNCHCGQETIIWKSRIKYLFGAFIPKINFPILSAMSNFKQNKIPFITS